MKTKRLVAAFAIGGGVLGGALAVSSPAWAACSNSAATPTSGLVSVGTRAGCAGSSVNFQVNFEKDVALLPDLPVAYKYTTFQNGTLSVTGNCSAGKGSYYTWVIVNGSGNVESPRKSLCY